MALTSIQLIGYFRAEYMKSAKMRVWMFFMQLLVAMPGAVAVVVRDETWTYILAVVGALILIIWWALNTEYAKARNAAHSARRAALLSGAMPEKFSAFEILSLKSRLTVAESVAARARKADYYATKLKVGPARLGEMLEESAFYSVALQRASATTMLTLIVVFAFIVAVMSFVGAPFILQQSLITIFRIILAVFVFVMSSDVIGAFIAHKDAARTLEEIRARLANAGSNDYPLSDVLLAMVDYNAAIEGAPESVPLAYRFMEKDLNRKWAEYQKDRRTARTAKAKSIV